MENNFNLQMMFVTLGHNWAMTSLVTLTMMLCITPTTAQAQESEKIYVKEFKIAKDKESKCIFFKDEAACTEMFAAYDRAYAAPDANEGIRHEVFKYRLQARAKRIEQIVGPYYSPDYITELQDIYRELLSHYEGGKHSHAIIENLRLQTQLADQLFFEGKFAEADRVLVLARETAEGFWNNRAQFESNPNLKAMFHQMLIDMPRAEKKLAKELSERSTWQTGEKKEKTLERAADSWKSFEKWVERRVETRIHHPMDQRWELEIALANFKLGFIYKDFSYNLRDEEESKRRFQTAAVFSCSLLDAEHAKELGVSPAEPHELNEAQDMCERSMIMLSGKLEQLAKESAERMIKQQMELLKYGQ